MVFVLLKRNAFDFLIYCAVFCSINKLFLFHIDKIFSNGYCCLRILIVIWINEMFKQRRLIWITMFYLKNISNMLKWNIQDQHKMDMKLNLHVIDMILNFKSISLCEKERFEPLKHVYHRIMTSACFWSLQ